MGERNRAWRRKKNFSKGRRKKNIAMSVCRNWWYKHDGQYIKGKVHCSCPMCSAKTNNRGRYGVAINFKHSDKQKVDSMDSRYSDYMKENLEIAV